MKQGTVSVLIGCHSAIHSLYVIKAWRKINNSWPKPWEIVCIALHDIGHLGVNYLDNIEEKEAHWILGAAIAQKLFGDKGEELIAGHCIYSGAPKNKLYYADKLAMYLAPRWWMLWCGKVEPGLHRAELARGLTLKQAVDDWRKRVKKNVESGEYRGNHELYLERLGKVMDDRAAQQAKYIVEKFKEGDDNARMP